MNRKGVGRKAGYKGEREEVCRPAFVFFMENYLCIDIGGTFVKYCLADESAVLSERMERQTPNSLKEFWVCMQSIEAQRASFGKGGQLLGVAVSLPGKIDSQRGYVCTGGCLPYLNECFLARDMERIFHAPVTIENDGVCAATAELYGGSLKGCQEAAVLLFGTGIGGALITGGQVRKGAHGNTAEFSFIIMGAGFYQEETLWAADNGDFHLRQLISKIKGVSAETLDGKKIFDMAESGDREVLKALRYYTKIIARNIYNLQAIFDLEKVAIGGGVSARPLFIKYIKENYNAYMSCVSAPIEEPEIVPCQFGQEANLAGALYLHLNK